MIKAEEVMCAGLCLTLGKPQTPSTHPINAEGGDIKAGSGPRSDLMNQDNWMRDVVMRERGSAVISCRSCLGRIRLLMQTSPL